MLCSKLRKHFISDVDLRKDYAMPLGFRLTDLIIYLVLALLIFGPKKLPEIGATIGRTVNLLKNGIKGSKDGIELENAAVLLEERKLELRRLELEALEREIASKKAELSAYQAAHTVEGTSESTAAETQAN
jgi:sec-independent protein translocase protein TatA